MMQQHNANADDDALRIKIELSVIEDLGIKLYGRLQLAQK